MIIDRKKTEIEMAEEVAHYLNREIMPLLLWNFRFVNKVKFVAEINPEGEWMFKFVEEPKES